ncbi:MAG: hydroxyacylglutathione hydrolase [Gammaproteobacteria bacterium]
MIEISPIPAFQDNYFWLICPSDSNLAAVVDPGDAQPVREALSASGKTLAAILVTHHHADHVEGVRELKSKFGVEAWGPAKEVPHLVDHPLAEGDIAKITPLQLEFEVLDLPGHTLGHIGFLGQGALFCGDTLFSAGCGRLFEGTPAQMTDSLGKLSRLPATTRFYCAHEYTLANLSFAATVEPENTAIVEFRQHAEVLRSEGQPTLPSTIGEQLAVNPFLRCHLDAVKMSAERWYGSALDDTVRVFAAVRSWKDGFRVQTKQA